MHHPHNKREREIIGRLKGLKRAKGRFGYYWIQDKEEVRKIIEKNAQLMKNTTKLCSCNMCGNPRREYGEATIQEIKDQELVQFEKEELTDWE